MALTGRLTLIVAVLLWLSSLAGTLAVWTRGSRAGRMRWVWRGGLLACCQLTAVALVAVMINDANTFYTSWREVLGGEHHRVTATAAARGGQDAVLSSRIHNAGMHGHGLVVPVRIPGVTSHLPALRRLRVPAAAVRLAELRQARLPGDRTAGRIAGDAAHLAAGDARRVDPRR